MTDMQGTHRTARFLRLAPLAVLGLVAASSAQAQSSSFATLDDPLGVNGTFFTGVNNVGESVGEYYDADGNNHGFTEIGGIFSTLDDPLGVAGTDVYGVNDAGKVVGDYESKPGLYHGFSEIGGKFITLSSSPLVETFAYGVNNKGEVVGNDASGGFSDVGGVYTPITDPEASYGNTLPAGVTNAGEIAGSYFDTNGDGHGFTEFNGLYTTLDDPLGVGGTFINGINNKGEVVGYYFDASGNQHGFTKTGNTYTTLDDLLGAYGTFAYGVTDSGVVEGGYVDSNGYLNGFRATPVAVPEASSLSLVSFGGLLLGGAALMLRAKKRPAS